MNNKLNQSEWIIMEVLWEEYPCTIMEMYHKLKETTGWSKSTVITLLNRMTEKGILHREEGGKAKKYYPNIEREDVIIAETTGLIDRIYKGSIGLMMSTLVKNQVLSNNDVKELQEMLKKAGEVSDRNKH